MIRARLATLAVAAGLTLVSGCCGLDFPRFARQPCCGECNTCSSCDGAGAVAGFEGPVLAPPDATYVAPTPMPPMGTVVPPTAPPPRIVPVPQANPMPYSPTGFRRLFGREP